MPICCWGQHIVCLSRIDPAVSRVCCGSAVLAVDKGRPSTRHGDAVATERAVGQNARHQRSKRGEKRHEQHLQRWPNDWRPVGDLSVTYLHKGVNVIVMCIVALTMRRCEGRYMLITCWSHADHILTLWSDKYTGARPVRGLDVGSSGSARSSGSHLQTVQRIQRNRNSCTKNGSVKIMKVLGSKEFINMYSS